VEKTDPPSVKIIYLAAPEGKGPQVNMNIDQSPVIRVTRRGRNALRENEKNPR